MLTDLFEWFAISRALNAPRSLWSVVARFSCWELSSGLQAWLSYLLFSSGISASSLLWALVVQERGRLGTQRVAKLASTPVLLLISSCFALFMPGPGGAIAPLSRHWLVHDGNEDESHERIALSHIVDDEWVVASPHFELLGEQLSSQNADPVSIRHVLFPGQLPLGVGGRLISFRPLTQVEERQLLMEADIIAHNERVDRGIFGPGGAAPGGPLPPGAAVVPVPPAAPAAPAAHVAAGAGGAAPVAIVPVAPTPVVQLVAPAGGAWILDEPTAEYDLEMMLPCPLKQYSRVQAQRLCQLAGRR